MKLTLIFDALQASWILAYRAGDLDGFAYLIE